MTMTEHAGLFLQGCKPAETIEPDDVIDGVCSRVRVLTRTVKPRSGMPPLVVLRAEGGEGLRYEPGFPVAYYGAAPVVVAGRPLP